MDDIIKKLHFVHRRCKVAEKWAGLTLESLDMDMSRKSLCQARNGQPLVASMIQGLCSPFVEVWEERRLDSPRGFLYNGKPLSLYLAEISVATSQCKS